MSLELLLLLGEGEGFQPKELKTSTKTTTSHPTEMATETQTNQSVMDATPTVRRLPGRPTTAGHGGSQNAPLHLNLREPLPLSKIEDPAVTPIGNQSQTSNRDIYRGKRRG